MTTSNRFPLLAIGVLILLPTGAQAQRISTWAGNPDPVRQTLGGVINHSSLPESSTGSTPAIRLQGMATGPRNGVTLAFGGLVGGALGFFAGGFSGVAVCGCSSGGGEYDALEAFFLGAAVGTAVTIPLGVHLSNHLEGSYLTALAVSIGISAVALAAAFALDDETAFPALVLMIPVSQIISSVLIERRTTPRTLVVSD